LFNKVFKDTLYYWFLNVSLVSLNAGDGVMGAAKQDIRLRNEQNMYCITLPL
jgi:hypothetical protein